MHDAIIIGAGHNALTCAYYLARKGLKVTVLEAADKVGGAAVTDEFLPGFRNSAASYTVSLLQPKVIREMELERHGLKVVLRKRDNFLPGDGAYLLAGRNGLTRKELARHVKADGPAYDPPCSPRPGPTTLVTCAPGVPLRVTPSGARGSSVIGTTVPSPVERYVVALVTSPVSGFHTAGTPPEGKVTSTVTGPASYPNEPLDDPDSDVYVKTPDVDTDAGARLDADEDADVDIDVD